MTAHIRPQSTFYLDVSESGQSKYSVVHKFGRNDAVGTSYEPVSVGGIYRTPQVSGATALRVKAGNANDASDGSGARTIFLEGIDENGDLASETISTNGESAGTASTTTFIRLFRAYVATTGTYATASAGSHAASIVIENSAGTEDWLTIDVTGYPRSQSEIAAYTVPNGKEAYIKNIFLYVESTKPTDILFYRRQNILDTSVPYQAARLVYEAIGVDGPIALARDMPIGPFPANTDIGFLAQAANSAEVSVNFDILLKNT